MIIKTNEIFTPESQDVLPQGLLKSGNCSCVFHNFAGNFMCFSGQNSPQ